MSGAAIMYLVGMGLLFIGERLLSSEPLVRGGLAVIAVVALAGSIALRFRRGSVPMGDDQPEASRWSSRVGRRIAVGFTLLGIGSLLLYALTLPGSLSLLGLHGEAASSLATVLSAIWPILWLCGTLPLTLVDWTLGRMPRLVQPRRVAHAAVTGLCVALAISLAFPVNFLGARHARTWDLRQIRTTAAGEATRGIVESLTEPVDVYLFFPPANDVERKLRPYFEPLARASGMLRVETVDQALAFELAERLRVSSNGSVLIARGGEVERINVGTRLDDARRHLRRFDQVFQSKLLQITRQQSRVYFTTGHEEMHWNPMGDEPLSRRISGAKRLLEQLNLEVVELGLGEGLGREVPADAAAVIIAAPRHPLLPEEISTLNEYASRGGRILLLLEPGEHAHEELTELLGVRFHPELVLNDRHHLQRSRTKADRAILVTNRFSSHPSVGTLARHSSRLALILDHSGRLETTGEGDVRASGTVRSMPRSWANLDSSFEADDGAERHDTFDLGVAVRRDGGEGEFRGAVLASAAPISDAFFGNQGNVQWLADTIRWLTDDEQAFGTLETEEDIRIQHTRDQDVVWFYGTTFAVPLMVLLAGLWHVRRRRGRS